MHKKNKEIVQRPYDRMETNTLTGLTTNEVQLRSQFKTNTEKNITKNTYFNIVFKNIFTFFNLLMTGIAIMLLVIVGPTTILNLGFMIVLLANLLIGITQEVRSKQIIDKLKLSVTADIKAIRNNEETTIPASAIVEDDILILQIGDQIPADCIIRDGTLTVNESILTGESNGIKKEVGDTILKGSFVISGSAICQVEKIADDTYLYSIESKAKTFKKPKSKLMESITKIIKILSCFVIPAGLLIFWNSLVTNSSLMPIQEAFKEAVTYGGTAMAGMIPCGMMLLSSVAMATGVIKLSKKKTLVQDLYSVESLSRIDTLCLDKTGTLTDGTMVVESVTEFSLKEDLKALMKSYLYAFKTTNQTSRALAAQYEPEEVYKAVNVLEFSSVRKYSAVDFEDASYALGAPEFLTNNEEILEMAVNKSKQGIRTLLLVKLNGKIKSDESLPKYKTPVALFLIRDNIRREVKPTMEWFDQNDVTIRVISGDNVEIVSYIAKQSGIKNWDKKVDLSTVSESDFETVVLENYIFGRVSPEQKAQIVDILKQHGHTVGITGDGINDILAMKKSDCAVALENGAPATKNIANIVLLDSNFSNMKDAVLEGRRVINNIQRSTTLFLMKDFFFLFLSIFSIILRVDFSIQTSIMSIINIFITGITTFLMSIEPSSARIEGDFMKNVLWRGIVAGAFMFLPAMAIHIIGFIHCGIDTLAVREFVKDWIPIMSLSITIAAYIILYNVCKPFTKYRAVVYSIAVILSVFILLALPDPFIQNSTDYLQQFEEAGMGVMDTIRAIIANLFQFNIYRTFTKEQWIFLGIFSGIICLGLYKLTDHFITKFLRERIKKYRVDND